MARKIAVEGETVHLKKSVAHRLVRRLFAVWVVYNETIRRVPIRGLPSGTLTRRVPIQHSPSSYIPKELPPAELPGLKFEVPSGHESSMGVFLVRAARVFAEGAR